MKIYILDCGKQDVKKSIIISKESSGLADGDNQAAARVLIPTWAVLIDHPKLGYVLFDTAISPDAMTSRWDDEMKRSGPYIASGESMLPTRLMQLGVDPKDIGTVIMSHLHNDHAGCLHMFKNATVYVHDDELKHAMKHYMTRSELAPYCWEDLHLACEAKLKWITVTNDDGSIIDLAEDLSLVNFGSGHAHGMLGLLLFTQKTAPKLLISDVLYSSENEGPPVVLPGIIYDTLGYLRSVKLYKRIVKKYGAEVWYGHDMSQWESLTKSSEGYYE